MKQILVIFFIASTFMSSSFVTARTSVRSSKELFPVERTPVTEARQLAEEIPWQQLGHTVGSFLINSLSDEAFLYLTSWLSMGNELLRSADEYLDLTETLLSTVGRLLRFFGAADEQMARQLISSDDVGYIISSLTGTSSDELVNIWRMISDALETVEARQGFPNIRDAILSVASQLNVLLRTVRDASNEATRILSRATETANSVRVPGFGRQMENTLSSMNNVLSQSATALSKLIGSAFQNAGGLYEAFSRLITGFSDNWNEVHAAGAIRIGENTYNIFDYVGEAFRTALASLADTLGMQTALIRFRALLEDLSQLQLLTTNYQTTLSAQMSTFTVAVSAAQVSTSSEQYDNVFSSMSNILSSGSIIVRETAAFAEGFTNLLSRALDDMHRLENDFTRAWIKWFPEEWGFDGDLSGWYNAGRLVAAVSRQLAQVQDGANQFSEALRVGSGFMNDAAGVAAAVDPGTMEGIRSFFG